MRQDSQPVLVLGVHDSGVFNHMNMKLNERIYGKAQKQSGWLIWNFTRCSPVKSIVDPKTSPPGPLVDDRTST
jgi:hypothetical protein